MTKEKEIQKQWKEMESFGNEILAINMKDQLKEAIDIEDYETAAILRDNIKAFYCKNGMENCIHSDCGCSD